MRKAVLLIWTNAAILIVLFALMAQSLLVVSRIAHTRWAHGQVQVLRAGQSDWTPVVSGTPIKAGDTIWTGNDGRAEFAWADGTRWKLEPQTRLLVQRAARDSWRGNEHTRLRLESGKVWVRVVKRLGAGSGFEIETPTALAKVRGTVWSIEARSHDTCVGVWKGEVEVETSGEKKRVTPGSKAIAGDAIVGDAIAGDAIAGDAIELQRATPADEAAFEAQDDLTHPELEVGVKLGASSALLSGQTEAGDALVLGCEPVTVLGRGAFSRRVPLVPGHNEWHLRATDQHGASTNQCRAAEFDGKTATMSVCR